MAYQFYLKHYDRDGTIKNGAIVNFLTLNYRVPVNGMGRLEFTINADSKVVTDLEEWDIIDVFWKNDSFGVPWHRDFTAFYRDFEFETGTDDITTFRAICTGQNELLDYRVVGYAPGTSNLSTFMSIPAETVMKTLVEYNLGASAIVGNGRVRNGDLAPGMGFTVTTAPDLGRGNNITVSFINGKILRIMDETLSPIAGGDYAFTKTGVSSWEFEFYPGQLGTDKSTGADKVEFSLAKGNLLTPSYRYRRTGKATVAIALGKGEGSDINYQIVTGGDYAADNDIEMRVDARNEGTTAGVIDKASAELYNNRPFKDVQFDVLQTGFTFYSRVAVTGRKTYREGDIVAVIYRDSVYPRKVTSIEVNVSRSESEAPPVQIRVDTESV